MNPHTIPKTRPWPTLLGCKRHERKTYGICALSLEVTNLTHQICIAHACDAYVATDSPWFYLLFEVTGQTVKANFWVR